MGQAGAILGVGIGIVEEVVTVAEMSGVHLVRQLRPGQRGLLETGIDTRLVERERVEGGKHAHVGNDRDVVARMAVARGRHIADKRDVEVGPSVDHGLGVFRHAAVEFLDGSVVREADGIKIACAHTPPATYTVVRIDGHHTAFGIIDESVVGTFAQTPFASAACGRVDDGLAIAVLVLLSGPRTATHTYILDSASEACHLMPLEMREGNEHVGVHDGAPDACLLHILAAGDGHRDVVRALQPVSDEHRTADGERREAVLPGTVKMFDGILAAAGIERVAVGQKRFATGCFHHVGHGTGIIGTEETQIAQLAEVHLDGDKLAVHVDAVQSGSLQETFQLVDRSFVGFAAKSGEKHF